MSVISRTDLAISKLIYIYWSPNSSNGQQTSCGNDFYLQTMWTYIKASNVWGRWKSAAVNKQQVSADHKMWLKRKYKKKKKKQEKSVEKHSEIS